MFYTVLKFKELLISLEPDVGLQWGMDQNVGIYICKVDHIEHSKSNIADK